MNEPEILTFAAIITLKTPGSETETHLSVMLAPTDAINTSDGQSKPLGDCTLAELQQFADEIEADLWNEFSDETLVDLVVDGRAKIDLNISDDNTETAPTELWLDHVILLAEVVDRAESIEDNLIEDRLHASLEVSADEEEVSTTATDEEDEPEDLASDIDPELQVAVAEPELVHEEREASFEEEVAEKPAVVPPTIRILGKRRPLNHPTWTAVDVLINESAFRDAQAHAISSPDREVAGVLVGPPPEKQPDGRYVVHISDTIIAKHTRMHGASVTYTPESWRYVNDKLAEKYPDDTAIIVGWYHTHPGFGIFLSGMDQFIHQNFFTQIWHVALVLDPHARRSGFFCWDRRQDRVDSYEFPWPDWASGSW
jgi:proteasome lid subunit RPN8/RPN11